MPQPPPQPKARPPAYGRLARALHWGMAAAVLPMIAAGLLMTTDGLPRGLGNALFLFHKNLGVILIPLIALRLIWRWTHPAPPLPPELPPWQRLGARASHLALYALLVVLPLSGFTRVRAAGFPVELLDAVGAGPWLPRSEPLAAAAQQLHYLAGLLLILVLTVHVAASLHHALIRRDGIWQRMWPGAGGAGGTGGD